MSKHPVAVPYGCIYCENFREDKRTCVVLQRLINPCFVRALLKKHAQGVVIPEPLYGRNDLPK